MKILVADDDHTSRLMLSALLKTWGYKPVVVNDGAAALTTMQTAGSPRIAILDRSMPEMNGLDVCRHIRQQETLTPPYIIFITSHNESQDIVAGLEAGADDYICKPFDANELRARLSVGSRMVDLQDRLKEALNILSYQAMYDVLTGIFNRRAILDLLEKEHHRAAREGSRLVIGLFDIDNFKSINDNFNHLVGDETLSALASLVIQLLRKSDSLGRYGGDEFLVILPNADKGYEAVFERLRATIQNTPFTTTRGEIHITISVGVSAFDPDESVEQLLLEADTALYQAKHQGRNRVILASKPLHS